jgi:DNA-binding response OmpR family regulator
LECTLPNHLANSAQAVLLPHKLGGADYAPRVLIVEDDLRYGVELMRALREIKPSLPTVRFEVDITPDPAVALAHATQDNTDIYIVDLKFPSAASPLIGDSDVGKSLIAKILERTKAGLIVHSSLPAERNAASLMMLGADDYIQKISRSGGTREVRKGKRIKLEERGLHEIIRAKVAAVWRRVQLTRPLQFRNIAHTGRVFLIGMWRFQVGNRQLDGERGERIRISATEHALLRYLCAVEDHEVDVETINVEILGRAADERDKRVDNYIYRIRNRLGPSVQLISKREGVYQLLTVKELLPLKKEGR